MHAPDVSVAGNQLDAGGEIVEISTDTREVWLVQGNKEVFMEKVDINSMLTGDLTKSYAHWWVCGIEHMSWPRMIQTASATQT